METLQGYESELKEWIDKERAATDLISSIGHLLYEKSVELVLFRNTLVDKSVSEILQLHNYAKEFVNKPIDIFETSELAGTIQKMELAPSKLDIGKLSKEWHDEKSNYGTIQDFLNDKLADFIGEDTAPLNPRDVVLYGFGRIGRLAARELIKQAGKGQQLRLKAIVLAKQFG